MTGAQIAAKAATQRAVFPTASTSSRVADLAFRFAMYLAVFVGTLSLVTLLYTVVRDGAGRLSWEFLTSFPSKVIPESSGIQSALVGTLYLMVITAVMVVPPRPWPQRCTSRSTLT
jgi:phosphate transport system permease protein